MKTPTKQARDVRQRYALATGEKLKCGGAVKGKKEAPEPAFELRNYGSGVRRHKTGGRV